MRKIVFFIFILLFGLLGLYVKGGVYYRVYQNNKIDEDIEYMTFVIPREIRVSNDTSLIEEYMSRRNFSVKFVRKYETENKNRKQLFECFVQKFGQEKYDVKRINPDAIGGTKNGYIVIIRALYETDKIILWEMITKKDDIWEFFPSLFNPY